MKRTQEIELTNMCLVYNESSILVQEKVGTRHPGGLVFPGGHVEEGESLRDSIKKQDLLFQIRDLADIKIGYKKMVQDT